jgi:hypothetical protein
LKAVTDCGTVLPLYHFEALITPSTVSKRRFDPQRDVEGFLAALESIVLERIKMPGSHLERSAALNPGSNCHGWIFTGGQAGIHDHDVPTILREHRYETVSQPSHGDLAIYRVDGVTVHSGIVHHFASSPEVLVRSKWGPFGVFFHRPDAHSGEVTFHRAPRWGHQLTLLPAA